MTCKDCYAYRACREEGGELGPCKGPELNAKIHSLNVRNMFLSCVIVIVTVTLLLLNI